MSGKLEAPYVSRIHTGIDYLIITFSDGSTVARSFEWLRDHARDQASFDHDTHQRTLKSSEITPTIRPTSVGIRDNALSLAWPGAGLMHATYNYQLLVGELPIPTGAGEAEDKAPRFSFAKVLGDISAFVHQLHDVGYALVCDCPLDVGAVKTLAEQLGYVRNTVFGGVWSFSANAEMADSAYSNEGLRPHTDATYSRDAPGLQILLCLRPAMAGGETLLVDGFKAARLLQQEDASAYTTLMQVSVPGEYRGDGVILRAERPVLRCDTAGLLEQVSYNSYDRAPLHVKLETSARFYAAIRAFDRIIDRIQVELKLSAGDMLVFDNWRMLHGRASFSGDREMCGTYINREDFESVLRQM